MIDIIYFIFTILYYNLKLTLNQEIILNVLFFYKKQATA